MPQLNWENEEDRKRFYRMTRAILWTLLIVFAILLLFNIVTAPEWLTPWIWLVYLLALWVPVYKFVRTRWPG